MSMCVDYRLHMKRFISIYRAGETKTGAHVCISYSRLMVLSDSRL